MQTLKTQIANKLAGFYAFAGFQIDESQIKELSNLILNSKKDVTIEWVSRFIDEAKSGEFGMIYSSPVSLMVALKQYKDKYIIPEFGTPGTKVSEIR
jgi:hypothetical protein